MVRLAAGLLAGCLQVLLGTNVLRGGIRGALAVCGEAMATGSFGFEGFVAGMMAGGLRFTGDGSAAGAALVVVCAALNRWRGQELRLPMRGNQMVEEIKDPAPMKVVRVAIPGQGRCPVVARWGGGIADGDGPDGAVAGGARRWADRYSGVGG